MNISLETIDPCKKVLKAEFGAEEVAEKLDEITREYQKHAKLPGFRQGKTPKNAVLAKFRDSIFKEAQQKIYQDTLDKAIEEHRIKISQARFPDDVTPPPLNPTERFEFVMNLEVEPEITVPEYKKLPIVQPTYSITEEDIQKTIRNETYSLGTEEIQTRPAQDGDVLLVTYEGKVEDQVMSGIEGLPGSYAEATDFPVALSSHLNDLIPGIYEALVGKKAGDSFEHSCTYPEDFSQASLAGKSAKFSVEVVQVKTITPPEIDEALASKLGHPSLDSLMSTVRQNLEKRVQQVQNDSLRKQIYQHLLKSFNHPLPESMLMDKTKSYLDKIMRSPNVRNLGEDQLKNESEKLVESASQNAAGDIAFSFVLRKIAEIENIQVTDQELGYQIHLLAKNQKGNYKKALKHFQQAHYLRQIHNDLLAHKVQVFVYNQAEITRKTFNLEGEEIVGTIPESTEKPAEESAQPQS